MVNAPWWEQAMDARGRCYGSRVAHNRARGGSVLLKEGVSR